MPGSRNIVNSGDASLKKHSTVPLPLLGNSTKIHWLCNLHPSYIPNVATILEHTGTIADNNANIEDGDDTNAQHELQPNQPMTEFEEGGQFEEGEISDNAVDAAFDRAAVNEDRLEDLVMGITDPYMMGGISNDPLIVDSSNNDLTAWPRRSNCAHKPNPEYANVARIAGWANACTDLILSEACAAEVHTNLQSKTADANSWEPAPKMIQDISRMKDGMVRQEWLKAIKKELKTLIESGTFAQDTLKNGEVGTPVMETFKVKVKSDGCWTN